MTTVLLVRHADVENPRSVLYGHLDGFPLSERGRQQAESRGREFAQLGISRIVSSPLERAVETANIIARAMPAPPVIETDPRLREADFSRYLQGVAYWQIPLLRPRWYLHKAHRGLLHDDEPIDELGGRVLAAAADAAQGHSGTIMLVSHADPLQAAWIELDHRARSEVEMHHKAVDRCGALRVEYADGAFGVPEYLPPPRVA